MPIVRVTGNYQVTIPAPIRKALHVSIGDFVEVTLGEEGGAVIKPVELRERLPHTPHDDTEDKDWARTGEEAMLSQYDDKDSAYDRIKL
ncbi:MAG: AbrB/MazE/SpoVT family DNA-binding domain-containing protein [Candidatus Kerfeldbacteria bacterium]|nr:AbrB/MazE/SpoVT family DNA-binding domain-containing protein [Candidatus Kerfeldbacteria bacterium]